MSVWYLVVRVTDKHVVPQTPPHPRKQLSLDRMQALQRSHRGTDYRLAELRVPDVAPYSDFWP